MMSSTLLMLSQFSVEPKIMTNHKAVHGKLPIEVVWDKTVSIDYDNILKIRSSLKVEVDPAIFQFQNYHHGKTRIDLVLLKLGKAPYEVVESTFNDLGLEFTDAAELIEFTRYFNSDNFDVNKSYFIVAMKQFKDVGNLYKLHPSVEGRPKHYNLGVAFRSMIAQANDVIYLAKRKI